jgi:4-diphosphocytidyl-2-C-methyl-D-erythritol kinase
MSPSVFRALAPGKVNLALFLGPTRADGLHELVSFVQPVSLADELELAFAAGAEHDEITCPGVEGRNLAADALGAYRRASGWAGTPVRVTIAKRVPVAAGMGGGSADAAAVLRLAARASGRVDHQAAVRVAPALGADVPALLEPGPSLITGAGEHVEPVPERGPFGLVLVPLPHRLSTREVYREADRLGLARPAPELTQRRADLVAALGASDGLPDADLLVNDLEAAARSLCPDIDEALAVVRAAGSPHAMVSGSGPTVFGLFPGEEGPALAAVVAADLAGRFPGVAAAGPVGGDFAAIEELEGSP